MNVIIQKSGAGQPVVVGRGNGVVIQMETPAAPSGPIGMVAQILFDSGNGNDTSGQGNNFATIGSPTVTDGIFYSGVGGGSFQLEHATAGMVGKSAGQTGYGGLVNVYLSTDDWTNSTFHVAVAARDTPDGNSAWEADIRPDIDGFPVLWFSQQTGGGSFSSVNTTTTIPLDGYVVLKWKVVFDVAGETVISLKIGDNSWEQFNLGSTQTPDCSAPFPPVDIASITGTLTSALRFDYVQLYDDPTHADLA